MRHIDGLDIPTSNREIALHLRAIREDMNNVSSRLDTLENSIETRRFRLQERVVGGLLLPIVGGMLLFLLTKTLV